MSTPAPIIIAAQVDLVEQPGLIAAAEQLSRLLNAASKTLAWHVQLHFHALDAKIAASPSPSAIVVSLLPETGHIGEPIAVTKARWRDYLGSLQVTGAPVFVRTIFRHLPNRFRDGRIVPLLERIRRLNLMAAELSHDIGVAVIDIDRAFAHTGGRVLKTGYRLAGDLATEVSAHTTVWSLLSFGLDDVVDPDLQEKAKTLLGDLNQIAYLQTVRASAARGQNHHG